MAITLTLARRIAIRTARETLPAPLIFAVARETSANCLELKAVHEPAPRETVTPRLVTESRFVSLTVSPSEFEARCRATWEVITRRLLSECRPNKRRWSLRTM